MKIIHLSDLHFGTSHPDLKQKLCADILAAKPDLIIISGDFTQVASHEEFKLSEGFIRDLPCPVFCVPGNHDMPRFRIFERFFTPFKRYKNYISDDLNPVLNYEKLCLVGINTARPVLPHWNWANGAISKSQRDFIRAEFASAGERLKILTLHHPLQKAIGTPLDTVVFGGKKALEEILDIKVDLVLSGHVHHASITQIKETIFLGASTALSSRLRRQENGYNIITLHEDGDGFDISHLAYKKSAFEQDLLQSFRKPNILDA